MVCESCVRQAGAIVAQNFNQFQDLFLLAENLYGKRIRGNRLAAVSGAGFEAVGMADSIFSDDYAMQLTTLAPQTVDALRGALAAKKLDKLVGITNPLDINPAADDELHAQAAAILANDPAVDAVIIGPDPLSPAMHTLAATDVPAFDLNAPASIARLLPEVARASDKPIIGVIDGGRAVAALAQYIQARLHADVLRGGVRE